MTTLISEVNWFEKEISTVAKSTMSLYVVDMFGSALIMPGDTLPVRSLKRAALWEAAANLESEVLYQTSDIRNQNFWPVVDNIFWDAIVSAAIETSNLNNVLDNVFASVMPASPLKDAFTTAVLLMVAKKVGKNFEDSAVMHISTLFATK